MAKQKAEQIDLPKGASGNDPKKKRDEEDLSIKKKESAKVATPKKLLRQPSTRSEAGTGKRSCRTRTYA